MEDMNIKIEYVQMLDTDKSYLIITDNEGKYKRVYTGTKAEIYASHINNILTEIYKK